MLRLGVAERGSDLAARGAPDQARHLGVDVDGGETGAREDVVEVDGAVVGAAARGEEAALPGTESDGLDGGGMEPFVTLGTFGDDWGAELARNDGGICGGLAWLAKEGGKRWEGVVGEEGGGGVAAGRGMVRGVFGDVGIVWVGNATGNEIGEGETAEEGLEMASGWRSGDWKGFGMIFENFSRFEEIASIIVGAGGKEVPLQ